MPRRTGFGRLLQLYPVLVAVTVGVAGSLVQMRWNVRDRRLAMLVPALGIVVFLAVIAHGQAPYDAIALQAPPRDTLQSLKRLGVPPGAVIAQNGYTEGILEVIGGTNGVSDGHAPYTDAELLTRARTLVDRSRKFFGTPGAAGRDPALCRSAVRARCHGWCVAARDQLSVPDRHRGSRRAVGSQARPYRSRVPPVPSPAATRRRLRTPALRDARSARVGTS